MKNIKNILIALSMLVSLQAIAMQPIPHPTQSTTLSGMPTDLKLVITKLLTNFSDYYDAVKAINALYQTDKKFRSIIENTDSRWLFHTLANNYQCISKNEIANDLKIASIKKLLQSEESNWLKNEIRQDTSARTITVDDLYRSPLGRAIDSGNLTTIKTLIEENHDFTNASRLLAYNVVKPHAFATSEFLLKKGLKPHCLGWALVNTASNAAQFDNNEQTINNALELLKLYIYRGVNVNAKRLGNTTALIQAIEYARPLTSNAALETVTLLLENGANPNIKNSKGKTALDIAQDNQENEIGVTGMYELLRKYGAKHANEISDK